MGWHGDEGWWQTFGICCISGEDLGISMDGRLKISLLNDLVGERSGTRMVAKDALIDLSKDTFVFF